MLLMIGNYLEQLYALPFPIENCISRQEYKIILVHSYDWLEIIIESFKKVKKEKEGVDMGMKKSTLPFFVNNS